jgi:hypothetical protein
MDVTPPDGGTVGAAAPVIAGVPGARRRIMTDVDEVARIVRSNWLEVLETTEADPAGDFFRCGGTSLLAMILVGELRHALALDLPVAVLFDHRTLSAFTDEVRSRFAAAQDRAVTP